MAVSLLKKPNDKPICAVVNEPQPEDQSLIGKIIVIKFGGNAVGNNAVIDRLIEETIALQNAGAHVIVVHGGGTAVNDALAAIGKKTEKVNGLRITDAETLDVAVETFTRLNEGLTEKFHDKGANSLGFCVKSTNPFLTKKMAPVERLGLKIDLGWVGEIVGVDVGLLESWLWAGWLPVVAPLGMDDDKHYYNINADHAALAIATAVQADALVFLTDVPGVLTDLNDPSSILELLTPEAVQNCIDDGIISGGMLPKLKSCLAAITAGVEQIAIINSFEPQDLGQALSTNACSGTIITKSAA
jgi:acetylglutamate kinase